MHNLITKCVAARGNYELLCFRQVLRKVLVDAVVISALLKHDSGAKCVCWLSTGQMYLNRYEALEDRPLSCVSYPYNND